MCPQRKLKGIKVMSKIQKSDGFARDDSLQSGSLTSFALLAICAALIDDTTVRNRELLINFIVVNLVESASRTRDCARANTLMLVSVHSYTAIRRRSSVSIYSGNRSVISHFSVHWRA